jgi:hypothetical protein
MPIQREELTEAQKVQRQISAMGDSVDLINRLIAEGNHTVQVHDTVERNYRHLEIMLAKEHIQNSGADFTPFTAAIAAGKAYNETPVTQG